MACWEILKRPWQTLQVAKENGWLLDIALDNLTIGRGLLCSALLAADEPGRANNLDASHKHVEQALTGLHSAGTIDQLPPAFLTRAWLSMARRDSNLAESDLDEAWEIAERGSMKLFLADIHLHRARLFFREAEYPWNKHPDGSARGPKDDLAAAEKLINSCGYHRRDQELADAKQAILCA